MQRFNQQTRANGDDEDDELDPDREGDLDLEVGRTINPFDATLIILALAVLVAMIAVAATQ